MAVGTVERSAGQPSEGGIGRPDRLVQLKFRTGVMLASTRDPRRAAEMRPPGMAPTPLISVVSGAYAGRATCSRWAARLGSDWPRCGACYLLSQAGRLVHEAGHALLGWREGYFGNPRLRGKATVRWRHPLTDPRLGRTRKRRRCRRHPRCSSRATDFPHPARSG
jgi:hypothetical protein